MSMHLDTPGPAGLKSKTTDLHHESIYVPQREVYKSGSKNWSAAQNSNRIQFIKNQAYIPRPEVPLKEIVMETGLPGANYSSKFRVKYYDSCDKLEYPNNAPVVLGMHGLPSTHKDLYPLVSELEQHNIRVILPNFPACGRTEASSEVGDDCDKFNYGLYGRSQFLIDFLIYMGKCITKVGVGVGFSMGTTHVIHTCANTPLFRSLLLLSPLPPFVCKGTGPGWLSELVSRMLQTPLKPLVTANLLKFLGTLKGTPSISPVYMLHVQVV